MGYLVLNDYSVTIQDFALKQWISSNDLLRLQTELRAQAKIKEYLVQKYDLSNEFTDTTILNDGKTYYGNSRIQLNYTAWATGNYIVGQYVSYTDGNVYRCKLNTIANEAPTNTTYWLLIGQQLGLNYLQLPYPIFDLKGLYKVGDRVFWKDKIYQCQAQTTPPTHQATLQDFTYSNIPPYNYFPDDKVNGVYQWGAGVPYSIVGIYPNFVATQGTWSGITTYNPFDTVIYDGVLWQALKLNTNKIPGDDITNWQSITWIAGDNRNQSLVDAYVALVLWFLSFRISPKVVPTWLQSKYESSLQWLQNCADGLVTLAVPEIQPSQGARIRFGGNIKQNNTW